MLKELGKGACGRVFLATQPELADRPVVLKLTPLDVQEHISLARLQHTHIMPLYAVYHDPYRNLRLLCMPYFGGATLDRVLHASARCPTARNSRDQFLAVLRDLGVEPSGPAHSILGRLSFVEAVCWIGACLADALSYAHESGLVHLDVKPSNILIAGDGQPMLLDFHLARAPLPRGEPTPDTMGGTPNYMAPEQHELIDAIMQGRACPYGVDARSDVFGLGAVLYEALGGTLPFVSGVSAPLCRLNPQVSRGLSDIVGRCLASEPAERYPDAALLATDLRCHLYDQPLQGVRNRSLLERYRKWRRRRPNLLRTSTLTLVLLATTAALLYGTYAYRQQGARVKQLIAEVDQAELAQAQESRQRKLRELHALAEQVRAAFGNVQLAGNRLDGLNQSCQALWSQRALLKQWLDNAGSAEAAHDMIDVMLFAGDLQVRLAPAAQKADAHRRVAAMLDEAETLFGSSRVLDAERARHRAALQQPADPIHAAAAPASTWEYCTLGRTAMLAGDLSAAAAYLDRAIDLQPHGYWPNFYRGQCAYRQGDYPHAAASFSVCIGSAPDHAGSYYNRALANAAQGKPDLALRDYDRALVLDPTFAEAELNRGMLHFQAGRFAAARSSLQRALQHGAPAADVYYDLAMVHAACHEIDAALVNLGKVLKLVPDHRDARRLRDSLQPRQ